MISELPRKTSRQRNMQSQLARKLARCVLSHNSPLHESDSLKASFQKSFHTKNCFACTLTNEQQCNPENSRKREREVLLRAYHLRFQKKKRT